MIDNEKFNNIRNAMERIFCLPINRSTYREIHNAFFSIFDGNVDNANALMETLLSRNATSDKAKNFPKDRLKELIDNYSMSLWVAKDVFEKGDFINIITSDLIPSPQQPVFAHRIKRIDGQEFQFITDLESTLHLFRHFLTRIHEIQKNPNGKKVLADFKPEIDKLKQEFNTL